MHIKFIAPAYRDHPEAEAFDEYLDQYLPDWAADLPNGYAWETDVPPRDQWEAEAVALARHLEELVDEDGVEIEAPRRVVIDANPTF